MLGFQQHDFWQHKRQHFLASYLVYEVGKESMQYWKAMQEKSKVNPS